MRVLINVKALVVAAVASVALQGCVGLAISAAGAAAGIGSAYALDSKMAGGTKCATAQGFFGSAKNLITTGNRCGGKK